MSSSINDRSNFAPEPLYPGHYYLVDCSEVIQEFMQVPSAVRMHMVSECNEMSEYDLVDVELTEVVECLIDINPIDRLDHYVENLLDTGQDVLKEEAINLGIYKDGDVFANTAIQNAHADAVQQLGVSLCKVLKQHGFYNEQGYLTVDYHQLLPGGLVAFKAAETGFR
jgi:hypothetical protein